MTKRTTGWTRNAARLGWLGAMLLLMSACASAPDTSRVVGDVSGPVPPAYRILTGWDHDNLAEAVPALLRTCHYLQTLGAGHALGPAGKAGRVEDWQPACAAATALPPGDGAAARHFFETWFVPVPLNGSESQEGLFTGYYECELNGSLTRTARFNVPIYRMPARNGHPLPSRAEIARGALAGRGLELLWVDDPIEAFIMEIQGSGRVRMPDGSQIGLNYAGQNGQKYYPIGRYLVEQGVTTADKMTMHVIRTWLREHPDQAQQVMNLNPSAVFFRLRSSADPRGASTELTPRRSLAVDPSFVPLGVPVWLDVHDAPVPGGVLRTLVMAQDTGGAIKGPIRGDYFWGHGDEAAYAAGVMKAHGRYFMLVPQTVAQRLQTASRT
jgi:membrane-bound lytic murein transglycosylase A